jgi:hypothetical protein
MHTLRTKSSRSWVFKQSATPTVPRFFLYTPYISCDSTLYIIGDTQSSLRNARENPVLTTNNQNRTDEGTDATNDELGAGGKKPNSTDLYMVGDGKPLTPESPPLTPRQLC